MEPSYRPATLSDQKQVYDLYMHPKINPYLVYDLMSEEAFDDLYARLLTEGELYIAESAGVIVGNYHLYHKDHRQSDSVYLATLVIDPSHHRRGWASRILLHIIQTARAQGKNRLSLEVSVNNTQAIALYQKFGFVCEGTLRQNYRVKGENGYRDDYLMGLLL